MWARIQYDRWNEEVERQKSQCEAEESSVRKHEEMNNEKEKPTGEKPRGTESDVSKESEALREDYEALFIVAKNTH